MSMDVTAFLSDSVVVAEGKLYVQGAGWNVITTKHIPLTYDRIGIGIIVQVPYTETNEVHTLEVALVDADGHQLKLGDRPPDPVTGDTTVHALQAQFNIGRPPTLQPGDEQILPIALNVTGLRFDRADRYTFVVRVDGVEATRLPFRVVHA